MKDIIIDSRKKSNLKYPSGTYSELDIFIPKYNIAFEFQDTYHYVTTWYSQSALSTISQNDEIKRQSTIQRAITLIVVPCWWDGEVGSLLDTIRFYRPDLQVSKKRGLSPLPLNPPSRFFPNVELPEVGELMLASFPTNSNFKNTISSNDWWMGEKYDGVRCCWNPNKGKMYTRHGREIGLMASMRYQMPPIFVDGEFWCGRGLFNLTFMLCQGLIDFISWNSVRLIGFDVPEKNNSSLSPFEVRYSHLLSFLSSHHPFCINATRVECIDGDQLGMVTHDIIENRGEGIILRKMNSFYSPGRNPHLVKFKAAFGDKEGLVVNIQDKSPTILLPGGQTFIVPPAQVQVPSLIIGDIITFSFEINSRKELPERPTITRKRNDMDWQQVVATFVRDEKYLHEIEEENKEFATHKKGYWTQSTMRTFLESFAKQLNFDPLHPQTWYTIPSKTLAKFKNGRTIMQKYGGYSQAIQNIFPDIGLDPNCLPHYWKHIHDRRRFFESFAEDNQFDPLIPNNWYLQSKSSIMSQEGAQTVMSYHDDNVGTALLEIFPEIGLQENHLKPKMIWSFIERRAFFENFAKRYNFDPLHINNWSSQSLEKLLLVEGAKVVLSYHNGNVNTALSGLFPELKIKKRTIMFQGDSWMEPIKRRKAFEQFANQNQFNPLHPENWISQSEKIKSSKVLQNVLGYYNGNISKALLDLFPEVEWEKSSYYERVFLRGLWRQASSRRVFFENFAKKNNIQLFNMEKWIQHSHKFKSTKHAHKVLAYHGNNLPKALVDLFPKINFQHFERHLVLNERWHDSENRRNFFESFAKESVFDPLIPENWYMKSKKIQNKKDAHYVLGYHNHSVPQALQDLFPDINWKKSKFYRRMFERDSEWHDSVNQKFIEKFSTTIN